MRWMLLTATLVLAGSAIPSTGLACPRCSHDSVSESLVDVRFVAFDSNRRLLTYRVDDASTRLRVADEVVPTRGERRVAWSSLRRGSHVQVVVREAEGNRTVVRVLIPERRS